MKLLILRTHLTFILRTNGEEGAPDMWQNFIKQRAGQALVYLELSAFGLRRSK
jgi:hypothetical protein